MKYMFYGCKSLVYLPNLNEWKIENLKDFTNMFSQCFSLSNTPDISSNFHTNINNLFFYSSEDCLNCINIKKN